ncbi:MAG: radical SAM protein [Elusimicrobia bacterium]|nr:radical SAM protein [Elusimicrobiota bacterium]
MATNSLLINFAGYPNEPFNFMPDNGLANLAGALMRENHKTKIWDCSTVDVVEKLFPYEYSDEYRNLSKKIMQSISAGDKPVTKDLDMFYDLSGKIESRQTKSIKDIGNEISKFVKNGNFDFIGFKLWSGAGFEGSMIIAEELKKNNPKLPIFAGGPHVDWFNERVFDVTNVFDVLVYGEGEETLPLLANYVEGKVLLKDIPNLIYKENGKTITTPMKRVDDLNKLALPVYDDDVYLAMKDNQKIKIFLIDESRGCPNSCNFCIHPLKSGGRWRTVDAKKVVDRIESLIHKYGVHGFRFAGSNPPPNHRRNIASELLKRGINIVYSSYAHIGNSTEQEYKELKKSGCCALAFGVESGSQEILSKSLNKKTKVEQIDDTIEKCRKAGIYAIASIIMPAPGETEATKNETLSRLLKIRPDSTVVFFPIITLGTEWEKNMDKFGFKINKPKEFFEKAMTYKTNTLCPPPLWPKVDDFLLDRKSFEKLAEETANFVKLLSQNNMTTQLFDQVFLVAEFSGMSPKEFGDKSHNYLHTGDRNALYKMVSEINENVKIYKN